MGKSSWKIIGISGVTNGGKTTLSKQLAEAFPGSVVINQDKFFREPDDPNHLWLTLSNNIRHQNWEHYNSVDWKKMLAHVLELLKETPSHKDALLIIEGHIIFLDKPLADLAELKYCFSLSKEECRKRRLTRNYVPPDPPGYYEECVWPMAKEYEEKLKSSRKDIVYLDGTEPKDKIFKRVLKDLHTALHIRPHKELNGQAPDCSCSN